MTVSGYGLLLITGGHTHQENYAPAFAADPRCRLIGLTDEPDLPPRRQELNRELADELGVPYLDDFDAAIRREDVQLVSICAEPERRERITLACIAAGKHVYLDKEPAVTSDGLQRLIAAAHSAGVLTQSFSLVRAPAAARARQIVADGRLGELTGLHAGMFFAKGVAGTADLSQPRQERSDAERFTFIDSKRELLCVGWYPLILFQWLTGARFTSVYAHTANYFFAEHQRNGVEDFASLILEMDNGLHATITVGRTGWCSHPGYGIHQYQLVGSRRREFVDAWQPRLTTFSDSEPWQQPIQPHPEDPMGFWSSTQNAGGVRPKQDWWPMPGTGGSDANCFIDCIQQQRPSDVPLEMAAHTVEVVLAAYRSAAESRVIALA